MTAAKCFEEQKCFKAFQPEVLFSEHFPITSLLGEVQWKQSSDFGANYTVLTPLSVIPDVDGDGVQDLIIFIAAADKVCHCEATLSPVTRLQGKAGMLFVSVLQIAEEVPKGL